MSACLPPEPCQWQAQRGDAVAGQLSPAAHWFFRNEWIAIDPQQSPSPPYWLAAPDLRRQQHLQLEPLALRSASNEPWLALTLVPALTSNPVFINQATLDYLAGQPLRIRTESQAEKMVARTLWPERWRLHSDAPTLSAPWQQLVRHGESGAQQGFSCHSLWRRDTATPSRARWGLGIMLNGAQGDDDEAHGGHFALTLGRWRDDGDIADWLVANFYNPDVVSEKGILPALVPMDNYLTDLNSGQQQYRPSWLVACGLADEAIASAVYGQLLDTLERVYDHRLAYQHTDNNCTGLSMDALRAVGIQVPTKGPTSRLLAPLLFSATLLRERSLKEAQKASRYMLAERTRLLPWQAFDSTVEHLLGLANGRISAKTAVEATFAEHVVSLHGLHFPQLPSARPWGREPVKSLFDYQSRVPAKQRDWKIIPVPAREFPASLRRPPASESQ